jgi:tetratricopeptide (TPR) repeat protein
MPDDLARAQSLRDDGIDALKRGERDKARQLLAQSAALDPTEEDTFIWLAAAVTDPEEKREALQQILDINPDNASAKAELLALGTEKPQPTTSTPSRTSTTKPAPIPSPVKIGALIVALFVFYLLMRGGNGSSGTNTPASPTNTIEGRMFVSKAMMGDDWPLIIDRGEVECRNSILLLFIANGKTYAINGTAMTTGRYENIREIWAPDPEGINPNKSIGPLMDKARSLCE